VPRPPHIAQGLIETDGGVESPGERRVIDEIVVL